MNDVVNFDRRQFVPEINRKAWGYIEYADPITEKQAADYELVSPAVKYLNPVVKRIVQILMERDGLSQQEAQQMFDECRQHLMDEAVPSGDCELAEEILAEDLGLELDYLVDILL